VNDSLRIQFVEVALQTPAFVAFEVQCPNDIPECEAVGLQRSNKLQNLILLGIGQHDFSAGSAGVSPAILQQVAHCTVRIR
jgi:hypothetical protein